MESPFIPSLMKIKECLDMVNKSQVRLYKNLEQSQQKNTQFKKDLETIVKDNIDLKVQLNKTTQAKIQFEKVIQDQKFLAKAHDIPNHLQKQKNAAAEDPFLNQNEPKPLKVQLHSKKNSLQASSNSQLVLNNNNKKGVNKIQAAGKNQSVAALNKAKSSTKPPQPQKESDMAQAEAQENEVLKQYILEQDNKLTVYKDKEQKMIKLLLAVKKRGVDIDRIYNHDVINDETNNSSDTEV